MNITAKLIEIMETQQVSASFKKREFVVEYAENPQYPEYIKLELIQDNCSLIDNMREGQVITVHFNLKGRRWQNPQGEVKYFNTLQAWKFGDENAQSAPPQAGTPVAAPLVSFPADDDDSDIPF